MEYSFHMDPHSLKRKLPVSNPDIKAILFLRHLYKAIEALHARITILEEDVDESKLIRVFGGRMCGLDEMKHLLQNHSRPRTSAKYKCGGLKCLRSYGRLDSLQNHVQESRGKGHQYVKKISNESYCLQCNKHFKKGKLGIHDFTVHEEPSNSRIDGFLPFLAADREFMSEAKGSPYATSVSNGKRCLGEQEQDTKWENGLDLSPNTDRRAPNSNKPASEQNNPTLDLNCTQQAPALDQSIRFERVLGQGPKLGFVEAVDSSANGKHQAHSATYSLHSSSDHQLNGGFNKTNQTKGYGHGFESEIGCGNSLAPSAVPDSSQDTSLLTGSEICTIQSGYDYSHGFLGSYRDVVDSQASTTNQAPSTSFSFNSGIQASGYDYNCSVVGDSGMKFNLSADSGHPTRISGYEYIERFFPDPKYNQSQYWASLDPHATFN